MKKSFFLTLLSISCLGLTTLAWACNDDTSSSENNGEETYTVTFLNGTGFTYQKATSDETLTVQSGEEISFSLDIGALYTDTATVLANETVLDPLDGKYRLTVTEDTTIKVSGIVKDVSNMVGTGTSDDAFIISRPIDLLYIADQVNAGNQAYSTATYKLGNDIDCKGETLRVIGDMRTENAFFSGSISSCTGTENNDTARYTISNFKLNATNVEHVGLFGCVQADPTRLNSGVFYGIRIDNFHIKNTKRITDDTATYCGSLIGYGMGVSAYLCDATNGTIDILTDDDSISYVGGLIGYQQNSYQQNGLQVLTSEIAGCQVDVDVRTVQGNALYAGGVVGYTLSNSPYAPSFIYNTYATGNVSGGIRSGGIVGGLGQYTSVSSVYSTGDVIAIATQAKAHAYRDETYCYAYSGGIVGFAENNTSISDCFFAGNVTALALAGASYEKAATTVGGGDEAGYASIHSQKYAINDCIDGVTENTATEHAKNVLDWREHDWIFKDNAFPTIHYEPSDTPFTTILTVKYVTKDAGVIIKIDGSTQTTLTHENDYVSLAHAFHCGELQNYFPADDENYRWFGYFFDEACTKPVPYCHLMTSDETIYAGFANYAPIVGNYELITQKGVLVLTLTADGYAVYQDGTIEQKASYQFDGEKLVLESVAFAKYYLGAVDPRLSINNDKAFDMNRYRQYPFQASVEKGNLQLYDGVYFTKSAPLVAYKQKTTNALLGDYYVKDGNVITHYTFRADGTCTAVYDDDSTNYTYAISGSNVTLTFGTSTKTIARTDLQTYDPFKGTWSKSVTVGKTYIFDGLGGWTLLHGSNATSGSYTLSDDQTKIILSSGETVTFDVEGFLCIEKTGIEQRLYKQNSFVGNWTSADNALSLRLRGINEAGAGMATITYANNTCLELLYETSQTNSHVCLYQLERYGDRTHKIIYGYFQYNALAHTLLITTPNGYGAQMGYTNHTLRIVDDYVGEWISQDEFFALLKFNGSGNYYQPFTSGSLMIGDERVDYMLDDHTLEGTFRYHGVEYMLTFDEETQTAYISTGDSETTLKRKDVFADQAFIGFNEQTFTLTQSYRFNGASNFESGGKLTVGDVEYVYKKKTEDLYAVYEENVELGFIEKAADGTHYELTLRGEKTALYLESELMGTWAIGGAFDLFQIGPTDLNGTTFVRYKNQTTYMEYVDSSKLTFTYEAENEPQTLYVFPLDGLKEIEGIEGIALSQEETLTYPNYEYCSKVDEWYGTWSQTQSELSVQFDGVSFDPNYRYTYGTANLLYEEAAVAYYYIENANGDILLWSQEEILGRTVYYTFTSCAITEEGAYVNADASKAYLLVEVDSLFGMVATDSSEVEYVFDGGNVGETEGTITAGEKTYSYTITAHNKKTKNATLLLTDKESGTTYQATLDYSKADEQTITLVEQTENEQNK